MKYRKCCLRDIIKSINAGASVNSEDRPAKDGEFGILKTSCVSTGVFRPEENKAILEKELSLAKVNPKKDRIIISRMNTPQLVGASGYIAHSYPNLFLQWKNKEK